MASKAMDQYKSVFKTQRIPSLTTICNKEISGYFLIKYIICIWSDSDAVKKISKDWKQYKMLY